MLEDTLKKLPDKPGIYIMRDAARHVLYVGKAKNLKNRVRSYFQNSVSHNAKTIALVQKVDSLEYIITTSEMEALLLESNLIKEHQPPYNILLKDDKGYPYLRLDLHEEYPALTLVRKLKKDRAVYFGPYLGAGMARDLMELTSDLFALRSCNLDLSKKRGRVKPCLKYHIGRCLGPCRAELAKEDYLKAAREAARFLNGNHAAISEKLRVKMEEASQRQDYERAATLRDRIARIHSVLTRQSVVLGPADNCDVLGLYRLDDYLVLTHFFVRSGRIVGVRMSEMEAGLQEEGELIAQYILRHFEKQLVPPEVLVSVMPEEKEALEEILTKRREKKVTLTLPQRGKKRTVLELAQQNAKEKLEKSYLRMKLAEKKREEGLLQLAKAAGLSGLPYRIECFDISHIQGTDTVASMVVLRNGTPEKKEYRRYKIKTVNQNNDFASMAEVISRRLRRAGEGAMADLMVIDGGKGQLSSALAERDRLGLKVPMIGLAKREEEIFLPGQSDPVVLGRDSLAVQILQTVRDEAHRFAITFFRSIHNKKGLLSVLESIPGIGKERKKALYKQFGSLGAMKEATLEGLAGAPGMNKAAAEALYSYLHTEENTKETP